MAGSNRSGNLRDASRAIPLGTLAAQLSTSLTCKYFRAVCEVISLIFRHSGNNILWNDRLGKFLLLGY